VKKRLKKIKYKRFSYQDEFQRSTKPKVFLSTGFGGGKTWAVVMKLLQLCSINYGLPGGLLSPSTKMTKRDVIPTIEEICEQNDLPYDHRKSDAFFLFPETASKIYLFHGEDEGRSIRGPNLAFMGINEQSLISEKTYKMALARVRLKTAKLKQVFGSGTPEEFNWCYEYFIETPRMDCDLIFGDARENDQIAPEYHDQLIESYDEQMVKQYVLGQYVNLAGKRAAWNFERARHVTDVKKIPGLPIAITIDFNVTPMAAVLWNVLPRQHNNRILGARHPAFLRAYDEVCIKNSNTYELAEVLKEKVDLKNDQVVLYPDPAGQARSTKSLNVSDIDILEQAGFTDIRYKSRPARVRDALNAYNALLNKDYIQIDRKCKHFIADNEQCTIKEGTNFEIDKKNLKRTHWLDGAKAMAEYEYPIDTKGGARVYKYR